MLLGWIFIYNTFGFVNIDFSIQKKFDIFDESIKKYSIYV